MTPSRIKTNEEFWESYNFQKVRRKILQNAPYGVSTFEGDPETKEN